MLLRVAVALRLLMLAAAAGAVVGAVLMFWEAGVKLAGAVRALVVDHGSANVVASVLRATDGFLFGVVLLVFAGAIGFGFALHLSDESRARLPGWMRVSSIGEIKHGLIELVLVFLVVDFATDVAEAEEHRSWDSLVLPFAILLIALASRCLAPHGGRSGDR
jgi:uncharacterized membrane protein YqhA